MPRSIEKSISPVSAYHALISRNREIEKTVRMLQKEQERNGVKILALLLRYPEVAAVNKHR
jgi:hypothetical protein